MKVVGNCPSCGNPIWADGPETTRRTCACVMPVRTQPITIQPYPVYPSPSYPLYPTLPGGTWWCNAGDPTSVIQTTSNTSGMLSQMAPNQPPPDEDAGMVPRS